MRILSLGVLGGIGTGALLIGIVALVAGIVAATGPVPFTNVLPPNRAAALLMAGGVAGAIFGSAARRVRSPVGAALLGAVAAIAASGVLQLLDPGLYVQYATRGERIIMPLLRGVVGLPAPMIWGSVRSAAARPMWRATAEIALRVTALLLGLFAAVMAAPFVVPAFAGLIVGIVRLPSTELLRLGVGFTGAVVALVGTGLLCLHLAGVPHGRGPLPGFDRRPPADA